MLSTANPLVIPATKACVFGSARFRSTYNMELWALEDKAVQTHSSRRQRMVVERLESEHSPAVTATGPCWMQRSLVDNLDGLVRASIALLSPPRLVLSTS